MDDIYVLCKYAPGEIKMIPPSVEQVLNNYQVIRFVTQNRSS